MSVSRRTFLQSSFAAPFLLHQAEAAPALLNPDRLAKFVNPLPLPPIARPVGEKPSPFRAQQSVPFYRLVMRQIEQRIHRDLPPTRFWGFDATSPGPTIEVRRHQPVIVEWANQLPSKHFLPIDHTIHGAGPAVPEVRSIVHVHGARVPPQSDGYPENWYVPGQSLSSFYPNPQDATMLWYHDHSMAITRLNMYAGLFGLYIVRDEMEDALNLPKGRYEIPLLLCDRSFRADAQLYYPVSGDPEKPWIPEFFGSAILANGALYPFVDVEPRRYRFRLVNASNSAFLYLALSNRQSFWQIGSDQGLLPAPVELNRLTLAPGERADLILDFKPHVGKRIVLHSDRFTICQFRVANTAVADNSSLPPRLRPVERIPESAAIKTRPLTLIDQGDPDDPTAIALPMLLNNAYWHDPVTENPTLGTTEIWSLINLTDDTHPIHLHQVRFQILDRRAFDVFTYQNENRLHYTAAAVPPDANELGWKDTVRADPGMVTRIIIRFEGFAGRFVWHCHVLEHEDFEMMRPYDILPAAKAQFIESA